MSRGTWYWILAYGAFFVCLGDKIISAKKFGLPKWKITIITFFCLGVIWGIGYLSAWVEAGFIAPPSVNTVRAWIWTPIFFLASALVFKIEPERLMDSLTMCCLLGFGIGKFSCFVAGCCYGYPYEGPFCVYNYDLGYNVFPIQALEGISACLLYICFYIYLFRTDFKITGRKYPVMLLFYTFRWVFEFLRDNEKIWHGWSALSFHAIIGGIVGAVWLFFTTASGKVVEARIKNIFRAKPEPVLSKEEYQEKINAKFESFKNPYASIKDGDFASLTEISPDEYEAARETSRHKLLCYMILSILIIVGCSSMLLIGNPLTMQIILVSFFVAISAFFFIYCLISYLNCGKEKSFFEEPGKYSIYIKNNNNPVRIDYRPCPTCGREVKYEIGKNNISFTCKGSKLHFGECKL